MIQRIQTVYLVLGALALLALLLIDSLWQAAAVADYAWYGPVLVIVVFAAAALALVAVFQYKNRKRQLRTAGWVQIATIAVALLLYGGLLLTDELAVFNEAGGAEVGKIIALLLPVVAYALFFLARRAIRSDIELVRSMDRLR